jgi:hypothetical protein
MSASERISTNIIDRSHITDNNYLTEKDINECSGILLRALNRVSNSKKLVPSLKQQQKSSSNNISEFAKAHLSQNIPNPFENETLINFFVPETSVYAKLQIVDLFGHVVADIPISKGETQIRIKDEKLNTGMYFYTLIVDGEKIDTKKMIVQ